MSGRQRAFATKLNRTPGAAAEARRDASEAFQEQEASSNGAYADRGAIAVSSSLAEIVNPVDYEDILEKHHILLSRDPLRDTLFFPNDDIEVVALPRCFRTKTPVPQTARDVKDIHVKECVDLYLAACPVVNKKYHSSYGRRTTSLFRMSRASMKSPGFLETLYKHEFEVDCVATDQTDGEHREVQTRNLSASSESSYTNGRISKMYDLNSSENDPPVEGFNAANVDDKDRTRIAEDRHKTLFSIYPMPEGDDWDNCRLSVPPPSEHFGYRIMVKCIELRLELEVEPVFAVMALYDAKEKRKISENFYFDLNNSDMNKMLAIQMTEDFLPSLSRSAVFSITHPSKDVYLVVKFEKVLQQGDISECADPYMKEIDAKGVDRLKLAAKANCQRLRKFRMPFGWTAINLADGLKSSKAVATADSESSSLDYAQMEQDVIQEQPRLRTGTAMEPVGRRMFQKSTSGLRRSTSPTESFREDDNTAILLADFKPVTFTVKSFFKQEKEKLKDEDLYRYLLDLKKPTSFLKRQKCIRGTLKLDISKFGSRRESCLTPSLLQVEPYSDPKVRPTREIKELPAKEVFAPWTVYENFLYVYPQSANFSSQGGSARNIAVKVQLRKGENERDTLKVIYGKSSCKQFQSEAWTAITYHNKTPDFYEEVKIELPPELDKCYHLLFSFYHISCHKATKSDDNAVVEPTFIGYTWLSLLRNGTVQTGDFNLPVAVDRPHANYSHCAPEDVSPTSVKWMDNHKAVFRVNVRTISSIYPRDTCLKTFFDHCHGAVASEQTKKPISRPSSVVSDTGSFQSLTLLTEENSHLLAKERLTNSIEGLHDVCGEQLVHFLHHVLNKLFQLLVRPAVQSLAAGGNVGAAVFKSLTFIAHRLHGLLPDQNDQHGRNLLLAQYVQYVFEQPQRPRVNEAAKDGHKSSQATPTLKPKSTIFGGSDTDIQGPELGSTDTAGEKAAPPEGKPSSKVNCDLETKSTSQPHLLVHEELAAQWMTSEVSVQDKAVACGWFFYDVMIKSIAQYLHNTLSLNGTSRSASLSSKFLNNTSKVVKLASQQVVKKHVQEQKLARQLNNSLAFFLHDALSVMDRGYVFDLLRIYLRQISVGAVDLNLSEFKLELYSIICSHEHFVPLNLPLDVTISPEPVTSFTVRLPPSSPQQPRASYKLATGSSLVPQRHSVFELTKDYRQLHFLTGLVLTDLSKVLEERRSNYPQQAVRLLLSLMARHDCDNRYADPAYKTRVASLYLPVVGIVIDAWKWLYKGGNSGDSWPVFSQFVSEKERTSTPPTSSGSVSVATRSPSTPESARRATESVATKSSYKQAREKVLTPQCTRDLLGCFLWVLKNIDSKALTKWWSGLSISRCTSLLAVLDLCVACFEYRGKDAIQSALSCSDMHSRLKEAILGVGTATSALLMRRQLRVDSTDAGLRWERTQRKRDSRLEDNVRPPVNVECDTVIEGNLATECSLVIIDTAEGLIQLMQTNDSFHHLLPRVFSILLRMLSCHQSSQSQAAIFATQRSLVYKFPELLFEAETELCSVLCCTLLRHCGSSLVSTRSQATASLYSLMRHNCDSESSFARIKVQVIVALSTIGGGQKGGQQLVNPEFLRRSLKTLVNYSQMDESMAGTTFPDQINDLAVNLNTILIDTVKMNKCQEDHYLLLDLMHSIANGYQSSPDLRLAWLQNMAMKHIEFGNHCEAGMCMTHASALVAEYLYLRESCPFLPRGCVAFQEVSLNVLEESAVSDDIISPSEDAMCTGKLFSESGLVGLLTQAAVLFETGNWYESAAQVYKLLLPIHEANRAYNELAKLHVKVGHLYTQVAGKEDRRVLGSFFRVAFYGIALDDLNGAEFVYREQSLTKLAEMSLRLQTLYRNRFPQRTVEILKDSGKVDEATLDEEKIYIQITHLEPYFDRHELRDRKTLYDKNFNIRRFVYSTPFTKTGKAHGELKSQWQRQTIITTENPLPYLKTRVPVIEWEEVELTPAEVAIQDMSVRTQKLKQTTSMDPPNAKLLQVQLQGAISTTVNQGPIEVALAFLCDPEEVALSSHLQKLRHCFREFILRCGEALDKNRQLIGEDQREYQREMERNFVTFKQKLAPMLLYKRLYGDPPVYKREEKSYLQKISRSSAHSKDEEKILKPEKKC